MRSGVVVILLVGVCVVLSGCGGSGETSTTRGDFGPRVYPFDVVLEEWKVIPERARTTPGRVFFRIQNAGKVKHSFVVLRSDRSVGEGGSPPAGEKVGEIAEIDLGLPGALDVKLEPGQYALICDLPGHYARGMREDLLVVANPPPGGS